MKEGRTPGDPSNGRSAPAIRSGSAEPSSSILAGPGDQAETRPPGGRGGGRQAVGGDGPRPAPPAEHLGRCPGSGALLAWPKLTIGGCRRLPPRPLRSPGRSLALADTRPMDTHTHPSLLPRAPARLLCPKGHYSLPGAQAGLWEPEVVAGTRARRQRTRTGPLRCVCARTSSALIVLATKR